MRVAFAVLVALALVVGLTVRFADSESAPPSSIAPPADVVRTADVAPAVGAAGAALPKGDADAAAHERRAVASAPAPEGKVVVQVVHHTTRVPVAGAAVTVRPHDLDVGRLTPAQRELLRTDKDELARQVGF